jgi:hypothetical protein
MEVRPGTQCPGLSKLTSLYFAPGAVFRIQWLAGQISLAERAGDRAEDRSRGGGSSGRSWHYTKKELRSTLG